MEGAKKISFGFSKSKALTVKPRNVKADIQFIDCIESKSIKLKGVSEKRKEELIIPINATSLGKHKCSSDVKEESFTPGDGGGNLINVQTVLKEDTLEEKAVKEILEDTKRVKETPQRDLLILQPKSVKVSDTESSFADYEDVPVSQFGLAMLRGMGWKPEKGIGKNEKIVEPSLPVVRPKGMGLGAEKRKLPAVSTESEGLELKKGSYVVIVAGSKKNVYGEVQSFDEDAGRVIIKASMGSDNISVNESMIEVVSKHEYDKNSRVLNLAKYEESKSRHGENRKDSNNGFRDSKRYRKNENEKRNGNHSP